MAKRKINIEYQFLEQQRRRLRRWSTPYEFCDQIRKARDHIGADVFVLGPAKFLREAWCASAYARIAKARRVRMATTDPPDFEVLTRTGEHLVFELTEAPPIGTLRQKEHEDWVAAGRPYIVTMSSPFIDLDLLRRSINRSVRKKIEKKKRYSSCTNLLVYPNFCWFGEREDEVQHAIYEGARDGASIFRSVWVLWQDRLLRISPNPFLGNGIAFRPKGPHAIGQRLKRYEEMRRSPLAELLQRETIT